jgi:hypothetical protein
MGWRATGKKLREQTLAGIDLLKAEQERHLGKAKRILTILEPADGPRVDPDFVGAAIKAEFHNERGPLIEYLSERPMGKAEQFALAQILKKPERKGGRPRNSNDAVAAAVATAFFKKWRSINKRSGIADWGHRMAMKHFAAAFAVELAYRYGDTRTVPSPETIERAIGSVLGIMGRTSRRQLTLDEALLLSIETANVNCRQNA